MILKYQIPRTVASDLNGYELLSLISLKTYSTTNCSIILDFSNNEWFDVNLCASFGALIDDLRSRTNSVQLIQVDHSADEIFKRNGFYKFCNPNFEEEASPTSVEFKKFNLESTILFQQYIANQLLDHDNFPRMSDLLKKKINKSIFFNNFYFLKIDFFF